MLRPTLLLGFSLAGSLTAATLRVPQDYSLVQRAIWAAAPGDTVAIAEGTYHENVSVRKSLTLQGAGAGKTILAGKDRSAPVLWFMSDGGASAVKNLSLRHEPEPQLPPPPVNSDEPPIEAMAHGLIATKGDFTLENVTIEKTSGYGATLGDGKFKVQNLIIAGTGSGGLELGQTHPGTSIHGLRVSDTQGGFNISAYNAAAEFKNLKLLGAQSGFVQVSGPKSAVKFADLSKVEFEKIAWEEGASPSGDASTAEDESGEEQMDAYSAQRMADRARHQKRSEPERRALARDLQSSLRSAKDAASHAQALAGYFKALLETYHPGETADFGVDAAIEAEVRDFYQRFGALAMADAVPTWPNYEEATTQFSYEGALTPEMKLGYQNALGANWVKANEAKLNEYFDPWKKMNTAEPSDRAAAFVKAIGQTSELLYSGGMAPEQLKDALRRRVFEEVNLVIAQAGYPTLQHLLRLLAAAEGNDLITATELQAALTPEQKRELFRVMRAAPAGK